MGNFQSVQKINFEDMQYIVSNREKYILINTLESSNQKCLIPNTINYVDEEKLINNLLSGNKKENIVIYGKNSNETKIYEKYDEFTKLGFNNVYIYPGGMFEWLCLQDIYSDENFPTTSKELDILKYKPHKKLNKLYLTYSNDID